MKKKIVVFAGNECTEEKEKYYYKIAYDTGKLLALSGFTVVTGGGEGLMNQVNKGAYQNGGEVIGVRVYLEGRIQSKYVTSNMIYKKLNPRQQKLLSLGDGYLAVPGGIGTFYEIFEVMSLKRKGEIPSTKPLILIDGYFREFEKLTRKIKENGFLGPRVKLANLYSYAPTPEAAVRRLKEALD